MNPPAKPRTPKSPDREGSFAHFCRELRMTLHMKQAELGAWFSVSGKTFARWESAIAVPSRLQVSGIIEAMRLRAPEHADRASRTLGVEPPARAAPSAALATSARLSPAAVAKLALEGALFEAAERLGVPSTRTREVAVLLFERAASLGLGVMEAAATLRGEGGTTR